MRPEAMKIPFCALKSLSPDAKMIPRRFNSSILPKVLDNLTLKPNEYIYDTYVDCFYMGTETDEILVYSPSTLRR